MNQHLSRACLLAGLFLAVGCSKHGAKPDAPSAARTVDYVLYTEKDFTSNHDTIRFEILMRTASQILLDSPLAPMTLSQVPHQATRIEITKTVPDAYRNNDLQVGFLYSIDNVGMSWYLDSSKAGNLHKIVTYPFQ
jgi:hypothetical protein